jgi:hypothetical protein
VKILSPRISILKKEGLLSIVILATESKRKLWGLFLWLLAWTVCGLIIISYYPQARDEKQKLFIFIYAAFWLYFEFRIVRVYTWRRWGKEKIWVSGGTLHYQRETAGRGKVEEYDLERVGHFRLRELNRTSLADTLNQSFWIKGGERIEFDFAGKTIPIGMQISDEEARQILKELNLSLKNSA